MNQLGILDVPTSGELYIEGKNVSNMTNLERTHIRRDTVGYIFQKFYLIPLLSAYENVEYPLILKYKKRDTTGKAAAVLKSVGFDEELSAHRPTSFLVVNSSVLQLHVHLSMIRRLCCVMNLPEILTEKQGSRSWIFLLSCIRKEKRSSW